MTLKYLQRLFSGTACSFFCCELFAAKASKMNRIWMKSPKRSVGPLAEPVLSKNRKCVSFVQKIKDLDGPFPAAYKPSDVEGRWYSWWVSNRRLFELRPDDKLSPSTCKKFTMVLPPPNVTGDLHVGHALTVTVEDVLQRWQRSRGSSCHWVPGFDHAGIATQVVVEKRIAANQSSTIKIDRHQMGRKAFVQEVLQWSNCKRHVIRRQLQSLGASLDWSNEVFTMDERFSTAVTEAFVRLHETGFIRRKRSLVNWCCHLRSTVSDMEVEHVVVGSGKIRTYKDPSYDVPIAGKMYRFAYKLADKIDAGDEIVVATTRPETIFGDVAVAVNPNDVRYARHVGSNVIHPFDGRLLPVIGDGHVDPAFGTGALKVTPGHCHEDFTLAARHGGLPLLNIFDEKGHVVKPDVPLFDGMNRFVARTAVVRELDRLGLFRGKEDHAVTLPVCSRSGGVVEPLLKSQWFLDTSQLSNEIARDLEDGNLVVLPEHALKDLKHWLSTNSKHSDWCLSRQLWWGHQIPAYRLDTASATSDAAEDDDSDAWIVARSVQEAAQKCGASIGELSRDEDVLDTWFSSALFPFVVHGWPDVSADSLRANYPLSVMETGRDILFFWVVRMLMLGKQLTGQLPFAKVLAHGMVCDAHGRKMSKSLGNVIDPTHVIGGVSLKELLDRNEENHRNGYLSGEELEKSRTGLIKNFPEGIPECGADALRFALCSQDVQDHTVSIDVKFVHSCKLFCNKIWQASRFYLMCQAKAMTSFGSREVSIVESSRANMSPLDLWILSQLAKMVAECDVHLTAYEFHLATRALKQFWYFQLCDIYLEAVKPVFASSSSSSSSSSSANVERMETCLGVLRTCVRTGLVALSPFMPFLTEELFQRLKFGDRQISVCEVSYPCADEWKRWRDPQLDARFDVLMDVVSEVRSFRQLFNVAGDVRPHVRLIFKSDGDQMDEVVETLARCVVSNSVAEPLLLKDSPHYELYVELNDRVVDIEKSLESLERRDKKLSKQLEQKYNAKCYDVDDDFQTKVLREKKMQVEDYVAHLRKLTVK